ncbi:HAD family phosphatase [Treponema sp. C6A8]|uniref:HAD family hydrolase n=1 Tax=Treponema sp. C6A8 TaxID=1410609 RepID=UPI0004883C9D|nr:HAD family phosphatase [Treponema sp. C6A8]
MIKNIIFDIGGVLVAFEPVRVLREMGLPEEEVKVIFEHTAGGPYWKELDRGVMQKEEVFNKMLSTIPSEYQADAKRFFSQEVLKTVSSFPYSADWLKNLKERGYKLYLLTNYPDWMFDYHWKNAFTFTAYVDGKIVSAQEKIIKPDHTIYQALIKKYNLIPSESVFIDDLAVNVQGARETGLNAIQFTNIEETKSNLESLLGQK